MKVKRETTLMALVFLAFLVAALFPSIPTASAGAPGSGWKPDKLVGAAPTGADNWPSSATDSQGNLWCAYASWDTDVSRWRIKLYMSWNEGVTWTLQYTIADSIYNRISPSLAIDPASDSIFLAYQRYSILHSDDTVYLARKIGDVWSYRLIATDGYDPSLTCEYQNGADNYLYVSYNRWSGDLNNLDLLVARSTDDGHTWEEKVARGAADTHVYGTPTITNGYNRVHVAYVHSEYHPVGSDGHIDVTTFHRNVWDTPSLWMHSEDVSMVKNDVYEPSIAAVHGGGRVLVAYEYKSDGGDSDVLYALSHDYGVKWQGGTYYAIADSSANEQKPIVTVDGMGSTSQVYGNIHLLYFKEETVGTRHNGIYYTQIPHWGFPAWHEFGHPIPCWSMYWSEPQGQIIDADGHATPLMSATTYERTVDGEEIWMPGVVWSDYRGKGTAGYYDIYYSTIDTEFKISVFPSGQKVVAGDSLVYKVTVTHLGGVTAEATLDWWSKCTCGISASYNPSKVTPTATSILTIYTSNRLSAGTYYRQATATIGGYRRFLQFYFKLTTPPTLTLNLSPSKVARGALLTISGQLTPAPGAPTIIYLFYRFPHETGSWALATTMTANAAGAYSCGAIVPMSLTPGYYDLVAFWVDLSDGSYAKSPVVVLTIT